MCIYVSNSNTHPCANADTFSDNHAHTHTHIYTPFDKRRRIIVGGLNENHKQPPIPTYPTYTLSRSCNSISSRRPHTHAHSLTLQALYSIRLRCADSFCPFHRYLCVYMRFYAHRRRLVARAPVAMHLNWKAYTVHPPPPTHYSPIHSSILPVWPETFVMGVRSKCSATRGELFISLAVRTCALINIGYLFVHAWKWRDDDVFASVFALTLVSRLRSFRGVGQCKTLVFVHCAF